MCVSALRREILLIELVSPVTQVRRFHNRSPLLWTCFGVLFFCPSTCSGIPVSSLKLQGGVFLCPYPGTRRTVIQASIVSVISFPPLAADEFDWFVSRRPRSHTFAEKRNLRTERVPIAYALKRRSSLPSVVSSTRRAKRLSWISFC